MQRFHSTGEESNWSLFLTGNRGNNGGGMDDSTQLDGAQRRLGSRHTLERSTGGKYMQEVNTSKYSLSSIDRESSSYEWDRTLEWREVCAYKAILMRVQMQCRCVQSIIRWGYAHLPSTTYHRYALWLDSERAWPICDNYYVPIRYSFV